MKSCKFQVCLDDCTQRLEGWKLHQMRCLFFSDASTILQFGPEAGRIRQYIVLMKSHPGFDVTGATKDLFVRSGRAVEYVHWSSLVNVQKSSKVTLLIVQVL